MAMKSIIVVRYVLLEQFVLQFIINFLVCSILFMKTDVELQEESKKKNRDAEGLSSTENSCARGFWRFQVSFLVWICYL